MTIKRGLLIVGVPVALAVAAYSSVALAAASGSDSAQAPMQYHHMRHQAGPGGANGTHDPANCPNMGGDGGSSSTTPGSDTSGQL